MFNCSVSSGVYSSNFYLCLFALWRTGLEDATAVSEKCCQVTAKHHTHLRALRETGRRHEIQLCAVAVCPGRSGGSVCKAFFRSINI